MKTFLLMLGSAFGGVLLFVAAVRALSQSPRRFDKPDFRVVE